MRNEALVFDIFITCIIFLLLRPKPIVTYWSMVCIGFWHVALFSEPRGFPPALSYAFGSFLPALFIAYGFWRLAFRFVLPSFTRIPLEGMVWYLGPFWVGHTPPTFCRISELAVGRRVNEPHHGEDPD